MNTFFFNADQWSNDPVLSIDRPKECNFFILNRGVNDKEISESETPEEASMIIGKRMTKAIEDEFSRLKAELQ